MANDRNAGRKKTVDENTIKLLYMRYLRGEKMGDLAAAMGVSRQTMSSYFSGIKDAQRCLRVDSGEGQLYLCKDKKYWRRLNAEFVEAGYLTKEELVRFNIRLEYMNEGVCTSIILADAKDKKLAVRNPSDDILHRAFGVKRKPSWEDLERFVASRAFPPNRHHMSDVLKDMDLSEYDPWKIIEKTGGRMVEDHQWVKITRLSEEVMG